MTDRLILKEAELQGQLLLAKEKILSLENQAKKQNKVSFINYIWMTIFNFFLARALWKDIKAELTKSISKIPRTPYQTKMLQIMEAEKDKCGYCEYFKRDSYTNDTGECHHARLTHKGQDPRITRQYETPNQWVDETCKKWKLDPEVLKE